MFSSVIIWLIGCLTLQPMAWLMDD